MTTLNRRRFLKTSVLASAAVLSGACARHRITAASSKPVPRRPNIVFIMADDMGYGDPGCYNPNSKTPTPAIDGIAKEGVRFTDAHAAGAWCVPSRYGLLTGRYPFRTKLDLRHSLIDLGRTTIASLLKERGYHTACIGKWHLGFEGGAEKIDFNKPMHGGPVDHGFDYFFGMHASLDIPPYYYIENDRCVAAPTEHIEASSSPDVTPIQGAFWREGDIAPGFKHDEVLPMFTDKATGFIREHRAERGNAPFFLYLALAAPHTPWLPTGRFKGMTDSGDYGDFVAQVDASVGRVLKTLKELGLEEDTLVVFTSDNGPVWFAADVARYDHRSTHLLRGMKSDAYEGGHRMPFVARWPNHIPAGSISDETICFTDMLATFAALVGAELPANAGEDSYNVLPAMLGRPHESPIHEGLVVASSIRQGDWKLIFGDGEGGLSRKYGGGEPRAPRKIPGELYNLRDDLSETTNLYEAKPEIVERLTKLMDKYREQGRSVQR
jgi:arylsulfatase A